MIMSDKTIICRAVDRPLYNGCEVGGLLTIIRPVDDGNCTMPVKVVSIGDKGELIAVVPAGMPERVQRRMFPRVRTEGGIKVKLQFDNQVNRYKGLKVYDISGGGIGVTVYSRNPIEAGHYARLDIELNSLMSNKIAARGEIVHCSSKGPGSFEYQLGIKFVEINARDQQKIIEFVNEEQKRREEEEKKQRPLQEQEDSEEQDLQQNQKNSQSRSRQQEEKQGAKAKRSA